jgi:hypothetical protein
MQSKQALSTAIKTAQELLAQRQGNVTTSAALDSQTDSYGVSIPLFFNYAGNKGRANISGQVQEAARDMAQSSLMSNLQQTISAATTTAVNSAKTSFTATRAQVSALLHQATQPMYLCLLHYRAVHPFYLPVKPRE